MFKLPADTPGTDVGWVYGTVAPDRKTVTAAGRMPACMSGHQHGTRDRLFGPRRATLRRREPRSAAANAGL